MKTYNVYVHVQNNQGQWRFDWFQVKAPTFTQAASLARITCQRKNLQGPDIWNEDNIIGISLET